MGFLTEYYRLGKRTLIPNNAHTLDQFLKVAKTRSTNRERTPKWKSLRK